MTTNLENNKLVCGDRNDRKGFKVNINNQNVTPIGGINPDNMQCLISNKQMKENNHDIYYGEKINVIETLKKKKEKITKLTNKLKRSEQKILNLEGSLDIIDKLDNLQIDKITNTQVKKYYQKVIILKQQLETAKKEATEAEQRANNLQSNLNEQQQKVTTADTAKKQALVQQQELEQALERAQAEAKQRTTDLEQAQKQAQLDTAQRVAAQKQELEAQKQALEQAQKQALERAQTEAKQAQEAQKQALEQAQKQALEQVQTEAKQAQEAQKQALQEAQTEAAQKQALHEAQKQALQEALERAQEEAKQRTNNLESALTRAQNEKNTLEQQLTTTAETLENKIRNAQAQAKVQTQLEEQSNKRVVEAKQEIRNIEQQLVQAKAQVQAQVQAKEKERAKLQVEIGRLQSKLEEEQTKTNNVQKELSSTQNYFSENWVRMLDNQTNNYYLFNESTQESVWLGNLSPEVKKYFEATKKVEECENKLAQLNTSIRTIQTEAKKKTTDLESALSKAKKDSHQRRLLLVRAREKEAGLKRRQQVQQVQQEQKQKQAQTEAPQRFINPLNSDNLNDWNIYRDEESGKNYYYNTVTKQTLWVYDLPPETQEALNNLIKRKRVQVQQSTTQSPQKRQGSSKKCNTNKLKRYLAKLYYNEMLQRRRTNRPYPAFNDTLNNLKVTKECMILLKKYRLTKKKLFDRFQTRHRSALYDIQELTLDDLVGEISEISEFREGNVDTFKIKLVDIE